MAASVMVTEDRTAPARGSHRSVGFDRGRGVLRAGAQRGEPNLGGLAVALEEQLGVPALVLLASDLVAGRRRGLPDGVVDLGDRPVVEQPRLQAALPALGADDAG